ncbi:MAG: hypothetical protein WCA38_02830 [Candidatus Acidiferrales bacterium]
MAEKAAAGCSLYGRSEDASRFRRVLDEREFMVKTPANPGGLPKEVFDGFQAQIATNRAQFYMAPGHDGWC